MQDNYVGQMRLELNDDITEQENIVMAVLFAISGPVAVSELARACECSQTDAEKVVLGLMKRLDSENGALMVREVDGKYQLCTSPKYFDRLVNIISAPKKPELSDVLLETLAIIANKSPATRIEIEKIRGVKSDFAVNKLVEYGLIEEAGRMNVPGRPMLFKPTDEFYRRFGVDNRYAMPKVPESMETRISDEVEIEVRDILGAYDGQD